MRGRDATAIRKGWSFAAHASGVVVWMLTSRRERRRALHVDVRDILMECGRRCLVGAKRT
jgi:hypothetical protein